jgi:4-diphosphocytidyl-2-C-methyl-D-erythritol kinase
MVIFPNAKINLGLRVTEKRNDGFHNLETCFFPVPYFDVLEIIPSKKDSFFIYNSDALTDNILLRARNIFRGFKRFPKVDIFLYKNIPVGSGLGGGSSDAAFLLKGLNTLFNLGIKETKLEEIAEQLGKDCPFFIRNTPSLASGTGNIFESVSVNLSGYYLTIITPGINISTKEAFSWSTPRVPKKLLNETLKNLKPEDWQGLIQNDFQSIIEEKYPEIKEVSETLRKAGSVFTLLSGTGSSVYGLFDRKPKFESLPQSWKVWEGKL